nr:hypothetical protein [Tanacetum cinerariifolium]
MTLSSTLKASGNSLICRCGPLVVVVVVVVVIVVGVSSSAYTILNYMDSPLVVGAFGNTWSIMVEVSFRAQRFGSSVCGSPGRVRIGPGSSCSLWCHFFQNLERTIYVKDKEEKDKIRTKPDENGKSGKARQIKHQFPLNYELEPGYIENYNSYPYDSSSFPQQYPCCEDCEGLSETDHCQSPQYTINHPIFNAHNDLLNDNNDLLNSQNKITIAQNKLMEQLTSMREMVGQFIQKKQEEKKHEEEQAANAQYQKIPACCDDDDDYNFAITPNKTVDSLSMGDEHLDIVSAMESDEFIKSSVKNLVPNLSESKGENGCDVPACFTTFSNVLFDAEYEFDSSDDQSLLDEDFLEKIFSNPLFEEEIIPMKIDQHHFNAEFDLIESLLNHDSSIIPSSSKIDSLLDEFASELTLLKSIPPRIDKTDCYHENEIRLTERLLYDNSSPRPPEEFVSDNSDAKIESFSPFPILEDDYDSERDILIREELLDNYSLSLPVIETYDFDIPSFSRPPASPPDGNTRILNIKMMGDNSE